MTPTESTDPAVPPSLSERLRELKRRSVDRSLTLTAHAVKVYPDDWLAIGYRLDEAADALDTKDARIAELERALRHVKAAPPATATHRHKANGVEYALIGYGRIRAENWIDESISTGAATKIIGGNRVDMREVAVCRRTDGALRVLPLEEFEDGRFEDLRAIRPSQSEVE